jgi:3-hydroxybutyryl-CoA dehydrogenase
VRTKSFHYELGYLFAKQNCRMRIVIIGEGERLNELKSEINSAHQIISVDDIETADLIFDLHADNKNYTYDYSGIKALLIVPAIKMTLKEISEKQNTKNIVGMNLIQGFIGNKKKEISFLNNEPNASQAELIEKLEWETVVVNDSIGMVTVRVISMIINEASRTLEEGTATKEDIDKAMQLGTNYPIGPLAWADKIGIETVVTVLDQLFLSTNDNRYRVSDLLRTMQLKKEKFY